MHRILFIGFFLSALTTALASPIAGTWRFNPALSTELSPWQSYDLVIAVEGDTVTLQRKLAAGRRTHEDTTRIDTTLPVNVVPADYWSDNRHLGAYMGGEKQLNPLRPYFMLIHIRESNTIEKVKEIFDSLTEPVEVVPVDVFLKLAASQKTYRTRYQQPGDPIDHNP